MSDELRECPFCGSTDIEADLYKGEIIAKDGTPIERVLCEIHCNYCGACMDAQPNMKTAIENWSKRADLVACFTWVDGKAECENCHHIQPDGFTEGDFCPKCGNRLYLRDEK